MKVKLRGYDSELINSLLDNRDYDLLVGYDADGKEVYTGDIVVDTQNGGEYKIFMSMDLNYLPFEANISNFKLKERN